MIDFKPNTKMQCFKEGGQVKYESRKEHKEEMSSDINQDKAMVKKAFKIHDAQEHKGEHTNLSKLRKGGRAKKDCGSVRKYKTGGLVKSKESGKTASAPSEATKRPNLKGSDVEKEKSKPAGHKDPYIKSKESGKSASAPSAGLSSLNSPAKFCGGRSVRK
jgi:hypothetical protein